MSVRAIVTTVRLAMLMPGAAAAQPIGGGLKEGVSLADVPNISDRADAASAVLDRRIGHAAGGFLAIGLGKDSQSSCGKG